MKLDVEKADWIRSPGRVGALTAGPFTFGVNTADGWLLYFEIGLRRWAVSWTIESPGRRQ